MKRITAVLMGVLASFAALSFSSAPLSFLPPVLLVLCAFLLIFKNSSEGRDALVFFILLLCTALFLMLRLKAFSSFSFPFTADSVTVVEGILAYDSSYSDSGLLILHILPDMVENTFSNVFEGFTSKSCLLCLSDEKALLCAFSRVRLTGRFSNGVFICSSIKVLKKGVLSHIREALILLCEKRLGMNTAGMMLLLGRAEDTVNSLSEKALNCGCYHVLALSGMHLSFIAKGVKKALGRTKFSKAAASSAVLLFVFTAGPRPSLVRALIMYFSSFLGPSGSAFLAFFLQLIITPYAFFNQGTAYSYAAVFALLAFSSFLKWHFSNALGDRAGSLLSTSVSVLLLSAPLQLLLRGEWYPQSIIASPAAAALAALIMAWNFLMLAAGPLPFLLKVNAFLSGSLERLFDVSSSLGHASAPSYFIFLFCVLLFPVLCRLYESCKER